MNERKSFFKERTAAEISELAIKPVYTQRGLTKKILSLDPAKEALEIRVQITPGKFYINAQNSREASRKCYKHGNLIRLSQPKTQEEAYHWKDIPLAIRKRDLSKLIEMQEEEISYVGYTFCPVQGNDRRKRIVPFVWCLEAARLFAYAENRTLGIEIKVYGEAARVKIEGANVICKVPSRTRKKSRYTIRLEHIPLDGVTERRAVVWSIAPKYERGDEPEHSLYDIRYKWEQEREGSEIVRFGPHDVAAYLAIIRDTVKQHNLTPLEMNPFSIPSRQEVDFYKKLCNNIVIFDPTLKNGKTRKLHLDEKCIFIARSIGILGHDETMYWDPARDGKLKDYNWNISEKA